MNITGRKERSARNLLAQIRKKYKKKKGQFITISEFSTIRESLKKVSQFTLITQQLNMTEIPILGYCLRRIESLNFSNDSSFFYY